MLEVSPAYSPTVMPAKPATLVRRRIDLPLASLSVASCGTGHPVIVVPATISLIDDWEPLIRFIGQRYAAHFFELPGHGGSTPFASSYRSGLVAELVEQLADALGADRFGVLGFSFGGLFALRTLQRCGDRVDRVCMLAPYIGREGLRHSRHELLGMRTALLALRPEISRKGMVSALRSPAGLALAAWFMRVTGRYETSSDIRARLAGFSPDSLDVLLAQVNELLITSADELRGPYATPCLFGMSAHDTTLDHATTSRFMSEVFPFRTEERWEHPYHCPPAPLSEADYERDFRSLVEWSPGQAATVQLVSA